MRLPSGEPRTNVVWPVQKVKRRKPQVCLAFPAAGRGRPPPKCIARLPLNPPARFPRAEGVPGPGAR